MNCSGSGSNNPTGWRTDPLLWKRLKPLAQEMRREPTPAENRLWQRIRGGRLRGLKFRRQHPIERFIVDFYCGSAKLVIEVDGTVHDYTKEEDAVRQEFLEGLGLTVMRATNEEVLHSLDIVVQRIEKHLRGCTGIRSDGEDP